MRRMLQTPENPGDESTDRHRLEGVRPVSVAPMMDRTDRHFRYFLRQMTGHTLLYTEMLTTGAILHGNRDVLLGHEIIDSPVSLQLGGSDPAALAECARIGQAHGYDEINLNVGCPSARVQSGRFGACLMAEPELVASAVKAMMAAVSIPVTVKHRIGVDDLDRYEDLVRFVSIVADSGCRQFTVHARKAWLSGLSPKENRNVPPLRYDDVYRLKAAFPELMIEINGGVRDVDSIVEHLRHVDAVMIGRAAVDNPYLLATFDRDLFGASSTVLTRSQVVHRMFDYVDEQTQKGEKLHRITRHMLTLFSGIPGTRAWKRYLSGGPVQGKASDNLRTALEEVERVRSQARAIHLPSDSTDGSQVQIATA
jgi:tRNA-dihydrouridine synthase A